MSTQLKPEQTNLALVPKPETVTAMSLIAMAMEKGASIEQMQQLFELKKSIEADDAKKAFNVAMAQFKANPPQIVKNVKKKAGQIDLFYASLDKVVAVVTPALAAVGVRHRWEPSQAEPGWVGMACILSHELGHSERTELKAQIDNSGGKNAIQGIASTVTYLERYTLLAATGLAATDTDDDGVGAGVSQEPKMKDHDLVAYIDNIKAARNEDELKRFFNAGYTDAQKIGDKAAMGDLIKARDEQKRSLR